MDNSIAPRRNRRRLLVGATFVTAPLAAGVAIFEPHKLVIDDHVAEPIPVAMFVPTRPTGPTPMTPMTPPVTTPSTVPPGTTEAAPPTEVQPTPAPSMPTPPTPPPPPAEPVELYRSDFASLGHRTSGQAVVLELADGRRFLRLEGLDTSNGPELVVLLSDAAAESGERAHDDGDFIELGGLKGNIGDSNYEIPADVDLDRFDSVVVWCEPFGYAFGAAPLD